MLTLGLIILTIGGFLFLISWEEKLKWGHVAPLSTTYIVAKSAMIVGALMVLTGAGIIALT